MYKNNESGCSEREDCVTNSEDNAAVNSGMYV